MKKWDRTEITLKSKLADQPALDWLRFALASVVVLEHSGLKFPGPVDGGLAVWVFLSLSGWLIGGILLRTAPDELPRFFFNRAARIWIPYWCAVMMLYAVAAGKEGIDFNWWKYLFYDLTFTHYNFTVFPQAAEELPLDGTGNHFWSLSVEEQFYLIAPFLLSFTGLFNRLCALVAFSLAVLLIGDAFIPIAAGVLAAITQNRLGDWHVTLQGRIGVGATAVASFVGLGLIENVWLEALFAVAVVLMCAVPGQRSRTALWFGAISFPLYLNGWIGQFAANFLTTRVSEIAAFSIAFQFAFALLVAGACWYLIDRPLRARRDVWYRAEYGKAAACTAYGTILIGLLGGVALG